MSYLIAFIIIIVAAGALLLFRQPVEAPEAIMEETARTEEVEAVEQAEMDMLTTEEEAAALESETSVEMESTPQNTPSAAEAGGSSTYEAEASYLTPKRTEHELEISLTLEGTTIVDANVDYDGGVAATPQHGAFDAAYKSEVIGKDINDVQLSRVGGASLTSDAFNEAVAEIRAQL